MLQILRGTMQSQTGNRNVLRHLYRRRRLDCDIVNNLCNVNRYIIMMTSPKHRCAFCALCFEFLRASHLSASLRLRCCAAVGVFQGPKAFSAKHDRTLYGELHKAWNEMGLSLPTIVAEHDDNEAEQVPT